MGPAWSHAGFFLLPFLFSLAPLHNVVAGALAVNVVLMLASVVVATAFHEAGHALVAIGLGLRAFKVYLGRGRAVWARRIGPTEVVVQAVPFTGLTHLASPTRAWLRLRLLPVYAAGPLVNAGLCALAMVWVADRDVSVSGLATHVSPLWVFALANGLMAVVNLIPAKPRQRAGQPAETSNDGWQVMTVLFRPIEKLKPFTVTFAAIESTRLLRLGRAADALALVERERSESGDTFTLAVARTDALLALGRWQDAAAGLRLALADPACKGDVRPLLLNNLAWADFRLDDPALLDEADEASREAVRLLPDRPGIGNTRGAVLFARGDLAAAEPLLVRAFDGHAGLPHNQAIFACCLAMLHARRDRGDDARRWLATAKKLSPKCLFLPRAEAALDLSPPGLLAALRGENQDPAALGHLGEDLAAPGDDGVARAGGGGGAARDGERAVLVDRDPGDEAVAGDDEDALPG